MAKNLPIRCSATSSRRRTPRLTGLARQEQQLQCNLLKLRAVLVFSSQAYGSKLKTARGIVAELEGRDLKASVRSLYHWRKRYLVYGFPGLERSRRSDRGLSHRFGQDALVRIVEAALRVERYGDIASEFRKLRAGISYTTFRFWVRKIQSQLRVVEFPERGGNGGLLV